MTAQDLKNSILQLAMQGKIVEQRTEEGTARELIEQIEIEKERLIKEGKIRKEKPLPKIVEEEIPFEIPESWEWVRLSKVVDVRDGTHDSPRYYETGIPLITSKNISNGGLSFDNVKYISKEDAKKINERSNVDTGDILFAMIGTIGNPVIVNKDREFCVKNVALFKVFSKEKLCVEYLYWFLFLEQFVIKKIASGGVQSFIALKVFRNYLFPLPPYEEQKRIVEKVEELLPYIEKYDKAHSKLEELNKKFPEDIQKSILQYAMQGKLVEQRLEEGTGEELYCQIQIEKEKLIKAGIIKKEKPLLEITEDEKSFEIPESWKWVKLNSLVTVIADGDHQPPPQVEVGVPFLVISNISQGNLSFVNTRNVSQEYYEGLQEARKPQNGDVLFTVTGSYGIVIPIKTDKAFCVQRHIAIIKKPFVSVDYLVKCLSAPYSYKQCKEKATGTAQKTVGLETLRNLILPLPPLAEQERIVAELEEVLLYCKKLNENGG